MAGPGRANRYARQAFVVGQIALSLVLLSAAGVLARSFAATRSADIGIERKPILAAWSALDISMEPARQGISRLEALPGVARVAVAFRAPLSLSGGGLALPVMVPDSPPPPGEGLPQVKYNAVSANYFATIGTGLIRGRLFTEDDQRPGEPVVIVNQAFADRFYGGADAVGRTIRLRSADGRIHRIVGVVENSVVSEIEDKDRPYMYLPYWREQFGEITYLVEPAAGAGSLVAPVRGALKAVHPSLEPRRITAMSEFIDFATAPYRATATLALALGVLGLALTAIGVYGVVAYLTTRRTREIGVRIALGAAPRGIVALVLNDAVRVAAVGIIIGLPAALWAVTFLKPMLVGVAPWDVTAFAVAATVLSAAVAIAALIPAWRATTISPSVALRTE